jgi:elongation factor G
VARIRNIGVAAHIDAGKTTVTERILFYAHTIHRMGTVDDGNTTTDFLDEERERGITIQSAAVTVEWKGAQINIIDTPGHVDFTAEVERCLRVLDGAVIVFCGHGGVEAQSETVWRQSDRYRLPRIVFVNKLDRVGADFDRVVGEIETRLRGKPLPLTFPHGASETLEGVVDLLAMKELRFDVTGRTDRVDEVPLEGELLAEAERRREELVEKLADADDELAEIYLEGGEVPVEALKAAVRRTTVAGKFQPVLCGAALRNVGVQPLIDAIVDYLPSPRDVRETHGYKPGTEEPVSRKHYDDQPFSGYIFKTVSDAHGEVSFVRIYSGKLKEGARVLNTRRDRREKIGNLFLPFADDRRRVKQASAGDIVAVVGLKFSSTGDTLAAADAPISYERLSFPDPVVSQAIEPRTNADREKLESVLARVSRDDPTFSTWYDEETGQQIIAGMGELHLEVRRHTIEEAGVSVNVGEPRVSYREGLRGEGEARALVETPLGGKPQFAEVRLKVEHFPNDEPGHVVFSNEAGPANVPEPFLEGIEEAARDAAGGGVLRGDPLINVRVTLRGGAHREGESTPAAFAMAVAQAFRDACGAAGLVLLEPIMTFEVVCPEDFLGGVLKDLQMRGAEVVDMEMRHGLRVITGKVPLSRMFEYASQLRSLTQGRGTCSLEPREYGEVSRQDYARLVGE